MSRRVITGPLYDMLERFMDTAAGEGLVLDGVDAVDLYIMLFPYIHMKKLQQDSGKDYDG